MSDLALENLSKTYAGADRPALNGLTLQVPSGQMLALLGPSGCGKSTALRLIAGLEVPTKGSISIDGAVQNAVPAQARGAVMVFQDHLLFPHMTVAENVGFGLRMQGAPSGEIAARVRQMLARVHLAAQADARPAMLSGGQAQRAALARALITRPRVLLLDEPLASLDPHLRAQMRSLIAQVQSDMGITTVLVTHDQCEAVQMAPRIALVIEGGLRQIGPARDFYDRPASLAVAQFFGGVNFWPAQVQSGRVESALGEFALRQDWAALGLTGKGMLTLRPEAVQIAQKGNAGARPARLLSLRDLGESLRAQVILAGDVVLEMTLAPHQMQAVNAGDLHIVLPENALWFIPQTGQ